MADRAARQSGPRAAMPRRPADGDARRRRHGVPLAGGRRVLRERTAMPGGRASVLPATVQLARRRVLRHRRDACRRAGGGCCGRADGRSTAGRPGGKATRRPRLRGPTPPDGRTGGGDAPVDRGGSAMHARRRCRHPAGPTARPARGPGGDHVVHQQHAQSRRGDRRGTTAAQPGRPAATRLWAAVAAVEQAPAGHAELPGHRPGEQLGLVEARARRPRAALVRRPGDEVERAPLAAARGSSRRTISAASWPATPRRLRNFSPSTACRATPSNGIAARHAGRARRPGPW